jgi:hypothetical protein
MCRAFGMQVTPLFELGTRFPRAGQQHLVRTGQLIADFFEKRMRVGVLALVAVVAVVAVVAAGTDAVRFYMFAVKHQHMGFLVVYPDDGVVGGHGVLS